jgi:putative chitinase
MTLTLAQLQAIFTGNKNLSGWLESLNKFLPANSIDTPNRIAAFLAQTGIESSEYQVLQEDLHYSAERLLQVFPTHFTAATAPAYANNPQKIANCIYANRYGNGNEASGDGWNYRGRGVIQITFKANYENFSQFAFKNNSAVNTPDLLLTTDGAIQSACWFWDMHNLNLLADAGDIRTITMRINGGANDLAQRAALYQAALKVLV